MMGLLAGTKFDRLPHCDRCEKPESECTCPPLEPVPTAPGKQTARIAVEKRKHGRMMTVIRGLTADDADLSSLPEAGGGQREREDGSEQGGTPRTGRRPDGSRGPLPLKREAAGTRVP